MSALVDAILQLCSALHNKQAGRQALIGLLVEDCGILGEIEPRGNQPGGGQLVLVDGDPWQGI